MDSPFPSPRVDEAPSHADTTSPVMAQARAKRTRKRVDQPPAASATHIHAAHDIFLDDPLSELEDFAHLEPTSVAAAAARWLFSAATLASTTLGINPQQVIASADAIGRASADTLTEPIALLLDSVPAEAAIASLTTRLLGSPKRSTRSPSGYGDS